MFSERDRPVTTARISREQRRDDTRRRLLAAARDRFEASGFDGARLRDVAADAGVAPGTIFVHFADKRDLLHACLFDDLEATIDGALRSGPPGLEPWLDHLCAALFGYYAERPKLSRVLLRESLVADPPWNERFTAQVARVHAAVAARFEAAHERGEVRGDPTRFAAAFLSFYYFALLGHLQGGLEAPRGLVAGLVASWLEGGRP